MVMLKKKREVNYRKGTTGQHCAVCDHFECAFQVRSCNGVPLTIEPRCAVIGLENGRAYRIGAKNLCDRFDNRRRLAALGETQDCPAYGYCAGCGEPMALDPEGVGLCPACEAASNKRAVAWSAK